MRLISLRIYSLRDKTTIREVFFNHSGLSLIVDEVPPQEKEANKSGSSIGKTGFIRCIDICLGAKDVKELYQDKETGDNQLLHEYIEDAKISLQLKLESKENKTFLLEREIFKGGLYFINGTEYKGEQQYTEELKRMFFSDSGELTFRQLIPFFIRLDPNSIFEYNRLKKYSFYQTAYTYLLQLSMPINLQKMIDDKDSLKSKQKKALEGYKTEAKLADSIQKEKASLEKYKKESLSFIKVNETFKNNESTNIELDEELKNETSFFYELQNRKTIIKQRLQEEKSNIFTEQERLQELFNETELLNTGLKKTFSELVTFHNSMCNLRIQDYISQLSNIDNEIQISEKKLSGLRKAYQSKFIDFRYQVNDEANSLFESYYERKMELKEKEDKLKIYQTNQELIKEIDKKLEKIYEAKAENSKQIEKIQNIFNPLASEFITKEIKIEFDFEPTHFPLTCNAIDGTKGTGDKRCITSALEFTIVSILAEKKDAPYFVIQDLMENVPVISLKKIFNYVRKNDIQFILPILKDRITELDVEEKEIILRLSSTDKLFKLKTQ